MLKALVLNAAAAAVLDGNDAVDVGKIRRAALSNRWAMYRLTVAEQFTVEMTAM